MPSPTHRAPEESRFLVVGLVRNAAKGMVGDIERIRAALGFACEVRWLVIESDSVDDTPALLETVAARVPGFSYECLGQLVPDMPLRTERIAHCRNLALARVRERHADVDYVMLADLDGVNDRLTRDGVLSCWERDDWSGVAANQSGRYYDIWALRHPEWSPGDCFDQVRFFERMGASFAYARIVSVYMKMIHVPPTADWIEVQSAFGGLAIYRREAMLDGEYVGLRPDGGEVCEHVPFNAALREKGHRIFINPRLVNTGYSSHMPWKTAVRKARVRVKRLYRRLAGRA